MVATAEYRKNAGILSWTTALFTFKEYKAFIISLVVGVLKKQNWASLQVSLQVRNCELTKKVANTRSCGFWQFKLRTCGCGQFLILIRNSANFRTYKY